MERRIERTRRVGNEREAREKNVLSCLVPMEMKSIYRPSSKEAYNFF